MVLRRKTPAKKSRVRTSCKIGYIYREPYTRKTQYGKVVNVQGGCIKARSGLKRSRKQYNKQVLSQLRKSRSRASRKTALMSPKKCRKGYTLRTAYERTTKTGKVIDVPASCIKSRGKGSSVRIGPLRKGTLTSFGYSVKSPMNQRRKSIEKAIQKEGALPVYRKLNAISVLTRNTNPENSSIFMKDRNWVGKKYGFKASK